MGCHDLLQGGFPTQASNPVLLHCRQILYHLSHQGVCIKEIKVFFTLYLLLNPYCMVEVLSKSNVKTIKLCFTSGHAMANWKTKSCLPGTHICWRTELNEEALSRTLIRKWTSFHVQMYEAHISQGDQFLKLLEERLFNVGASSVLWAFGGGGGSPCTKPHIHSLFFSLATWDLDHWETIHKTTSPDLTVNKMVLQCERAKAPLMGSFCKF